MADALCGPSNALQNFQKHSSVDRTLQQDRLVSRQSPAQGFRGPAQNAGALDPEFEAFQAGQPRPDVIPGFPPGFVPRNAPPPPQAGFAGPSALPDWASDFQRLQVSSPPPAQQHFQPQAAAHNVSAAWHQDFLQHQSSSPGPQAQQGPAPGMYNPSMSYGGYGAFQQRQPFMMQQDMSAKGKEAEPVFDDAAFAQAFDAAHADIIAEEEAMHKMETDATEVREAETVSRNQEEQSSLNQRPESLLRDLQPPTLDRPMEPILDHQMPLEEQEAKQEERQQPSHDDEELARTAGQLLDSVSHETNKKFQESSFLALMRRLRDYEVRVDGDKMVETAPQTAIPESQQDLDLGRDHPRTMTGALQNGSDNEHVGESA
ncbi:uncharacterized protein K452DRAFT_283754 [Aplosporella prunicola CBS 121167]|uniref:Peroxin 20 n=1 Tax=Aplosporella prunicola CBS 121167 TaxID=1176127 RepID=A0A6A6BQ75_9PEZI|nr:uncharacterized protein K452DRAFT_283754 [Aplosporella prunicola CBS 121167]KAF2145394.1 hypothetical protein K452DRAFT_283754 [Aplosporella prunicola CBS 121167]